MHVLLLDLDTAPDPAHEQVALLVRALRAKPGVEPLVACPRKSPLADLIDEETLLPLPGRSPWNPLLLFKIRQTLRRRDITLVHAHGQRAALACRLIAIANKTPFRVVLTRRETAPLPRPGIWRYAAAWVAPTGEIATHLTAVGFPQAAVHTVPYVLDPESYQRRPLWQQGRFVFLVLSPLTPGRGLEPLIEAMSLVHEMDDLPPWEVRIVGQGPLFATLLEKARSLNADSHLALLGPQDARLMLDGAHALIAPAVDSEPHGLVIAQAWASDLPLLCSGTPAYAELVHDKHDALLTPPGNPVTLASGMVRCMKEAALRERLVNNGRESLNKLSIAGLAQQIRRIYAQIGAETHTLRRSDATL